MEEAETSKTKASDSAYSNSSTSQYQRSDGSSKSRHSNSSGSSGYCGQPSVLSIGNDDGFPQPQTCTKRKEKKRKQHKQVAMETTSSFWDGKEGASAAVAVASGAAASDGRASLGGAAVLGAPGEAEPVVAASEVAPGTTPGPQEGGAGPQEAAGAGESSEALQMAALTQTLHCLQRMKGKEATMKCLQGENGVARSVNPGTLDSRVKEHLDSYFNRDTSSPQDEGEGFVVVVSMADGTVVHTTPSLSASLGFPCDMWLGRDFIDFVHPKDRMSFASHITSGVARGEDSFLKGLPTKTSFYCSLRQYRGLRNVGYGVTRKRVPYLPFRLTFTFREMNIPLEVDSPAVSTLSPKGASAAAASVPMAVPQPFTSPPVPMQTQEKPTGDANGKETEELNRSVFIVITATRIYSAYKVSNEEIMQPISPSPRKSPPLQSPRPSQSLLHPPPMPEGGGAAKGKFVTRHLPSCYLSHIDPMAVPYLGYLPQDMEGRSVMDFYHPEDMPILKEAYLNVMSQPSSPFKGKPYRFRTQNGSYILVETEWSSFVNPWSRKLEFVIGQHQVLKGPSNPQVFAEPGEDCHQFPDKVLKESEAIHKDIMFMLDQKVTRVSESARQQVSKRCRDLAFFMETLMDEMAKPADPLRVELPAQDEHCFSERDSVMLGEISPHHDYYDGKSSTETPPSYNQLNYNENLQRFFESKPKTMLSDESADMKMEGSVGNNQSPLSTDEEGKSLPNAMDSSSASGGERKYSSQANESESGGSGSRARGGTGVGGRAGESAGRGREAAPEGVVGGSYQEDHEPVGGVKAIKPTNSNAKLFRGSRGSAMDGQANTKGCLVMLGGQEKGRGAPSQQSTSPEGTYHGPHLTEALLSRHNEDMEKIMVQKHREQRSLDREGKHKDGRKSTHEKAQEPMNTMMHGVKRSGSHSMEGDRQRVKHQHIEQPPQQQYQHGGIVVGSHHRQWAECQLPMAVTTAPPPPAVSSTMGPVKATALPSASTMASSSVAQNAKGNLRMSVVDRPLSPLPSVNLWPPISVTLTPMNTGTQPCLTYSYPGMMMPPKRQQIPNLASSAPPAIVPHGSVAMPELPNHQHRPHPQPPATLLPVPPALIPTTNSSSTTATTAGGTISHNNPPLAASAAPPRPPQGLPYPPLIPLQPFPSHLINPQQGGMFYYMPAGSAGMVPMQVNVENSRGQPAQVAGFSPQQVPLPPVPGFPYLIPMHPSQGADLPSMGGTPYIPNHPQYANAMPQVLYQAMGSTQANGSAGTQQLFVPSLNTYMPAAYTSYHTPSAHLSAPSQPTAPEMPLLQRAPPNSAASTQFLQRVQRPRGNHHSLLHHIRLQEQVQVAKGLPHQGEGLLRGREGLGVLLMTDREALSSASATMLGGANGKGPEHMVNEADDEKGKDGNPLVFSSKYQRPSSQATSVKAEPGSAVGSIASASRLRELLEVSKKCKSIGSSRLSKGKGLEEEDEEADDEYYRFSGERKMSGNGSNNSRNGNLPRSFNLLQDPETICDDSSYSSIYSFLRTDKSDESMRSSAWDGRGETLGCNDFKGNGKSWGSDGRVKGAIGEKNGPKPLRKGPSWLEEVDVTPDLILRYKMDDQILRNVLEADMKALKTVAQSSTVNEQLSQLYMDMELEGKSTKLSLEDSGGFTSSGTDEAPAPLNGRGINLSPSPSRIGSKSKKKRRSMDYGKLVMIFEEDAPFPPPSFST
ncbi:period circadian protein [Hetaerina americana]|uniref:period circadian protein n=1 Tax=Hetaerina americana TaxID=62018 RepID=UPI003A7F3B23